MTFRLDHVRIRLSRNRSHALKSLFSRRYKICSYGVIHPKDILTKFLIFGDMLSVNEVQ